MSEHDHNVTDEPEIIDAAAAEDEDRGEAIDHPAKIMRIGSMIKQLLEEVRNADLDEKSRDRLRDIYEMSVSELASTLSDDLREELERLAHPFAESDVPSGAELRIAQAQLVGWLEGLFQGIQATMFAQQMMAQQQLQSMRGQLPAGQGGGPPAAAPGMGEQRPGTYL